MERRASDLAGLGEQAEEWAVLQEFKLVKGMFVAQVIGQSMEPLVTSGSFCLFRPVLGGAKEGRKLLVWHAGLTDQETSGQYTLKIYHSEKTADGDGVVDERIVLKPINKDFSAIVLKPASARDVRAVAELVRAL